MNHHKIINVGKTMVYTIMAKNLKSSHRNISFLKNKVHTDLFTRHIIFKGYEWINSDSLDFHV